jgi:ubiquinone/menaquinone biosynthesis C-methylase UbiE
MGEKSLITKELIKHYNVKADEYFKGIPHKEFLLRKPFSTYSGVPFVLVRLELLFKTLKIERGTTVLDFGAGSCWLSCFLNKMGCKSIALDVSPTAIEMGKRLFELDQTHDLSLNPQFLTYDGFTFPMEDQVVDVIISFDAYHHVPNPEAILREMFRILKDKGKIGFCEPGKGHSRSPHAVEEMEVYDVFEGEVTYKDLKKLAPKIGFDKIYGPNPVSMIADHYHWSFIQRFSDSFWPFHRLLADFFKIIILEKGSKLLPRSTWPSRLNAKIQTDKGKIEVGPDEIFELRGRVRNLGDTIWLAQTVDGLGKVRVGVRLKGKQRIQDHGRVDLERDVLPREYQDFSIALKSPGKRGGYELEIDMVNEGICWFKERGSQTKVIAMVVS